MLKNLFKTLFFHSPKRTFFVVGGLIVMLSLPVTLITLKQQQDIRQRASGEIIKVTDDDYVNDYSIAGKENYDVVFDPSQGGWVYVPTSNNLPPVDEGTQTSYQIGGDAIPTFSEACTITTSGYDSEGKYIIYDIARDNCQPPYRCEPRTGYGDICVEPPQTAVYDSYGNLISPGSVQVGGYCRYDNECQTLICYYAPGWAGASNCINPLADNQACHKNSECQSRYCSIYPGADLGLCKTQCSAANCEGTCNTQTNECSVPTATNTPTPSSTNTANNTACSPNGVKSVTYDKVDCPLNNDTYRGALILCNDGYQTNTQIGICQTKSQLESLIIQQCASHTICPPYVGNYPPGLKPDGSMCEFNYECQSNNCFLSPDNTKKCFGMPPPPQNLTCDPNKDGKIDMLDFQWLKDEMIGARATKEADCFSKDGVVNPLDFQVWKDINFGKRPAF